jgi:hypothetical protein
LMLAGVIVESWPQGLLGRDLMGFCLSKTFTLYHLLNRPMLVLRSA